MKVLVADDNSTTRLALRRNLENWGHEVVEAEDGERAWAELSADDPPRIAILDWMMPGIDGIELCRRLTQREEGPFVYTILLTAKRDRGEMVVALDAGAHNFQSKPFSAEEIRSYVNVGRRLVEADDQIKEYASQMERLAAIDPLTEIYNRRHFLALGEKELGRAKRYGHPLSVLLMDIDHFKVVNDTYGHAGGDHALRGMVKDCLETMRDSDIFGRLGGEEFAVILPETSATAGCVAAERLRVSVENLEIDYDGHLVRLTISIGVAALGDKDSSIDALLRRADDALYRAKNSGRNQVSLG